MNNPLFTDETISVLKLSEIAEDIVSPERLINNDAHFNNSINLHLNSFKEEKFGTFKNNVLLMTPHRFVMFEKDNELISQNRRFKELKRNMYNYVSNSVKKVFSEPNETIHFDITTFENVNYNEITAEELKELRNLLDFCYYKDCVEEVGDDMMNKEDDGIDGVRLRYCDTDYVSEEIRNRFLERSFEFQTNYDDNVIMQYETNFLKRYNIYNKFFGRNVLFEKNNTYKPAETEELRTMTRDERRSVHLKEVREFYLEIYKRYGSRFGFKKNNFVK